jgi:hypothetical protein
MTHPQFAATSRNPCKFKYLNEFYRLLAKEQAEGNVHKTLAISRRVESKRKSEIDVYDDEI